MKKIFAFGVWALLMFAFTQSFVEAKSVSWSGGHNGDLYYYWNFAGRNIEGRASGWEKGLASPNVTVTYQANVYNVSAGNLQLNDGASVPVGTQLRFSPKTLSDADISWFGTGYSADSPNGHWVNGAAAPGSVSCNSQDFAGRYHYSNYGTTADFDVYVPLAINPPAITVTHAGTAGLTCDGSGQVCTVTSPGTINSTVNFSNTSGRFYYRYYDFRSGTLNDFEFQPGCYGNNTAMAPGGNCTTSTERSCYPVRTCPGQPGTIRNFDDFNDDECTIREECRDIQVTTCSYTPFDLNIPARAIAFTLTVPGSANQPPNPPTITGPTTGAPNQAHTFGFQATDPDNNSIRYGVDWDQNGSVDQWLPGSGYVPSNTQQPSSYNWTSEGTKTFQALTQDSNGAQSGWASYTITLGTGGPACHSTNIERTSPASCAAEGYDAEILPRYVAGSSESQSAYAVWSNNSGDGSQCAVVSGTGSNIGLVSLWGGGNMCAPQMTANLQINNSDGPLSVTQGTALNISWTSTGATSCTAWGAGWGAGGTVPVNGTATTSANQSDTYIIQCTNGTTTVTDSVQVTLSNSLKICQNSCSSGVLRGSSSSTGSFTLARGGTQNLVACFNAASGCSDGTGDVTTSASWTESGTNATSLSGTAPKVVTGDNPGSETISTSYSGQSASSNVTVTCVPTVSCDNAPGREDSCQNETFTVDNGCGVSITCNGTKTCNYNWKEVSP